MDFFVKRHCRALVAGDISGQIFSRSTSQSMSQSSKPPESLDETGDGIGILKKKGFSQVQSYSNVDSLRKALFQMAKSPAHLQKSQDAAAHAPAFWCLVSLDGNDEKQVVFGLLRDLVQDLRSVQVLVTLAVGERDKDCLAEAFALGLWSWMDKPKSPEGLKLEIEKLDACSEAQSHDERLIAADYLRSYLVQARQLQSQVNLEEGLVERYFSRPDLLMHLAEAQLSCGKIEDGLATLKRARFYDRSLQQQALALLARHGHKGDLSPEGAPSTKSLVVGTVVELPFRNAVLVDQDSGALRAAKAALQRAGIKDVASFEDGLQAWEHLRSRSEPALLITEWRMPGLTGAALIQRVRSYGFLDVPIVILSSLLKPADGGILTEMSVANVVSKPMVQSDLIAAIEWTAIQENAPTEIRSMERRIIAMLKSGHRDAARRLKLIYMAHEEVSLGEQRYVEAEFYFDQGQYTEAKLAAIESIKLLGKSSLLPLNLLGKCLLKLRDFDAALRILEQARQISPENLGRILDLADLHLSRNDPDAALEMVSKARSVDPTLERIDGVEAKAHILGHRTKKAFELIQKMESLSEIVSYMNNHAVALAQVGKHEEAVALYKNTLESLPLENYGRPDRAQARVVVSYNLALCLCRQQDLQPAVDVLHQIVSKGLDDSVSKKAEALLLRVSKAIESGADFNMATTSRGTNQSPHQSQNQEPDTIERMSQDTHSRDIILDPGGSATSPVPYEGPCLVGIFKPSRHT